MSEIPGVKALPKSGKEQEHALTPSDQEEMRNASITLLKKFFEDYPDKLPDAIILPDTSARPLAYLLRPVLLKASKVRGVALPRIYFFNYVETPDERKIRIEAMFEKSRPSPLPLGEIERISQGLAQTKRVFAQDQRVFAARARQIMEDLKRQGIENPVMSIFDDHVTIALRTSKGINIAFGRDNIPLYSFFSDIPEDLLQSSGIKVRTGEAFGEIPYKRNLQGIGVTKNLMRAELVSESISPPNIKKMTALRSDLSIIGQEVASTLSF